MTMANPTEMRKYLDSQFRDTGIVELRHQVADRWTSGLFDDPQNLLREAMRRSEQGNLFTSLNTLKLMPVKNQMGTRALKNDDVLRYARLFFDFDPKREKNTPSTESELCDALEAADEAENFFTALGWPKPARAVSGNGAHLQYRVALPNNDETTESLGAIYSGLKTDLSTNGVDFDATVRNPARICCLYGAIKRKGVATEARPHRQSQIEIPNPWKQVTRKQIGALAKGYTRKAVRISIPATTSGPFISGRGDYKTLNAVAWFRSHGAYKRHLGNGKHAIICPWLPEHSSADTLLKTDTVFWESTGTGWPTFHCSHAHCVNRTIKDVMAVWNDADRFCAQAWRTQP